VVGSTDQQVIQLLALANREGRESSDSFDWQALTRQQTFTTVADEVQPGAVPTDLDRYLPNSIFDRTTQRQVMGPITAQQWQAIKAQPQLNRVFLAFRIRNNDWLMTPTPTAGDTIAYSYITSEWAQSASGVGKTSFTADNDTARISENLITLGLIWRFLRAKGLDYAEEYRTYQGELQRASAKDGGATFLDITGVTTYNIWGNYNNIPIGSFPG